MDKYRALERHGIGLRPIGTTGRTSLELFETLDDELALICTFADAEMLEAQLAGLL